MPVPFLKSLSKETGKSINELEKLWGKAKKIASEHFNKPESEFGNTEFAYVVGVVKKMAGKEEKIEILTVTEDTKIPGTEIVIKKGKMFEFSVVEEDSVSLNEKTDWGKIEQALLKHGLKFNKYGVWFNDRNFELTRMYLSSDYTILTFYNQKGFKSMFNGMEFPLLIVAEYEDAIEDINKERPDDIRIFDDADDGYSYASHLDSRAEEYSRYKNSRDFLLTQKEICEEVEIKDIEIKEEVRIPGTDIILEAGDQISLCNEERSYAKARYVFKCTPFKNKWKIDWIDNYWDTSGYFFVTDTGVFNTDSFHDNNSETVWQAIIGSDKYAFATVKKLAGNTMGLFVDSYPFGKKYAVGVYSYRVPELESVSEAYSQSSYNDPNVFKVELRGDRSVLKNYAQRLQMHSIVGLFDADYRFDQRVAVLQALLVEFRDRKDAEKFIDIVNQEKRIDSLTKNF